MAEIVKTPTQVRVYLSENGKSLDEMFDVSFRNNIWSVTVSSGPESSGMVFTNTKTMREFFEAGLEIIKQAEASD